MRGIISFAKRSMVKGKDGENQSYFMKNEHKKTPENLDFPGFLSF